MHHPPSFASFVNTTGFLETRKMRSLDVLMLTHIMAIKSYVACMSIIFLTRHYKTWDTKFGLCTNHLLFMLNGTFLVCSIVSLAFDRRYTYIVKRPYFADIRSTLTFAFIFPMISPVELFAFAVLFGSINSCIIGLCSGILFCQLFSQPASYMWVCLIPLWKFSKYRDPLVKEMGAVITVTLQTIMLTIGMCMETQKHELLLGDDKFIRSNK